MFPNHIYKLIKQLIEDFFVSSPIVITTISQNSLEGFSEVSKGEWHQYHPVFLECFKAAQGVL